MTWILETSSSYSFVFLRLGLAVTFFFHSTQQIFGWHGGRGLKAHLANWRDRQGIPTPIGALGLFIEFFGSLAPARIALDKYFADANHIGADRASALHLLALATAWRRACENALRALRDISGMVDRMPSLYATPRPTCWA